MEGAAASDKLAPRRSAWCSARPSSCRPSKRAATRIDGRSDLYSLAADDVRDDDGRGLVRGRQRDRVAHAPRPDTIATLSTVRPSSRRTASSRICSSAAWRSIAITDRRPRRRSTSCSRTSRTRSLDRRARCRPRLASRRVRARLHRRTCPRYRRRWSSPARRCCRPMSSTNRPGAAGSGTRSGYSPHRRDRRHRSDRCSRSLANTSIVGRRRV